MGFYTDVQTLTCLHCPQGTYQPQATTCLRCPLGFTTAGQGAAGLEEDLCVFPNPVDCIVHMFQIEVSTSIACSAFATDVRTIEYQSLVQDVENNDKKIIIYDIPKNFCLSPPVVTFVEFRYVRNSMKNSNI